MNELINKIDVLFKESMRFDYCLTKPSLRKVYDEVQVSINKYNHLVSWEEIYNSLYEVYSNELINLNSKLHRETEIIIAKEIIKNCSTYISDSSWITKGFRYHLDAMIHSLSSDVDTKTKKNICIIGGGALPQTHLAVASNKQLNCKVTTVDIDQETTDTLCDLLRKAGYEGTEAKCLDGAELNLNEFDIIIIATLVIGKERILKNFSESNHKGIICLRRPTKIHKIWREDVNEKCLDDFMIIKEINTDSSAIYTQIIKMS